MIRKEQKELLEERLKSHPELLSLRKKLLLLGGEEIVSRDEPDLNKIIRRGKVFREKAKLKIMRPISCHSNVAELYADKGYKIATGYALSNDGLWRQHSWCIDNKSIIETTKKRKKYFGFILTDKEAQKFLLFNML